MSEELSIPGNTVEQSERGAANTIAQFAHLRVAPAKIIVIGLGKIGKTQPGALRGGLRLLHGSEAHAGGRGWAGGAHCAGPSVEAPEFRRSC